MDRSIPALIIAVVLIGIFALMLRSWKRRSRRDSSLAAGYPHPAEPGRELASVPALYVATTPRDLPLERLAIRGLGFRARAELTVTDAGLWMLLAGENGVFIPAGAIDLLAPATWTIDRVVETDGLLVLGWRLAGPEGGAGAASSPDVDSYFRIVDPADRRRITEAIRSIAPQAENPAGIPESEA
ncbi:MAG TPA: hypothetical protein VEX88_09750 [Glaciibacter sp.]|nr:hypothetical protein [Glaciibacter sp.]